MEKMKRIKIFDTTLRDGEQSPGATLTHSEKILITKQLEKLNVDVIEAGFPVASDDDFNAVNSIASEIKKPVVCALARCIKKDIDVTAKAIEKAKNRRIHVFLATSPIHMKFKLKKTPKEIISTAIKHIKYAKEFTKDIEFSPEDASRTKPEFLFEVVEKAINAGATTINIPDTVGYTQPNEYGALIKSIKENVPNIDEAIISVHCHNDLGLAVANSIEAIRNGAEQVECTINGIGERAGNASLEEIVMNIYTRKDYSNAFTEINFSEIMNTSKMVSSFTGLMVQANKAIVGKNAFAHESGIHQHGVLNNPESYEIMNPKIVGKETELIIGKHSGKHAIKNFIESQGFSFTNEQLEEVSSKIKLLADKQKKIFNEDIIALANQVSGKIPEENQIIKIKEVSISTGNKIKPTANVVLDFDGKEVIGLANGLGPVDAVSKAIKNAIGDFELKEYNLKAITGGTDALADVVVLIDYNGKTYSAEAINEDVIMASTKALIKALNKGFITKRRRKK